MEARKPDDIMAECLLKGGKMLSRACRACGSPLFEVKGETLCVVCAEKGKEKEPAKGAGKKGKAPGPATAGGQAPQSSVQAGDTDLEKELRATILDLARKAREETDPDRCVALMEAARKGAEALSLLQR
jgi:UPF0148 protein